MAVVGCERADLALHHHTEVPMLLPDDFIQTIFSTPLGELLQAVGAAFKGGQGGPSLPPPMAAGNLSDAIGAALIDDGHGDLVTQGTTPDGSTYNEIGPDLTDAAADVLWALGWPVAYRTLGGEDKAGAPMFFCPSLFALESALIAVYAVANLGDVPARGSLIVSAKLHAQGYGDYPF